MKKTINFLLILALSTTVFAQKYKLELNLKKGAVYTQTMISSNKMIQTTNGKETNVDLSLIIKVKYKVIDIKDSIYDLDAQYETLSMNAKASSGNGFLTFSSTKKDNNDLLSTALQDATNKPFRVKISKSGKLVDIQNIDSLLWKFLDEMTFDRDIEKLQTKAQFKNVFGNKAFKNNLENATAIFPAYPVSIGEKWTTNHVFSEGISAQSTTTYELKAKNCNSYIITGTMNLKSSDNDVYKAINGMEIKSNTIGSFIGTTKISKKTGWIKEQKMNFELIGSTVIKESPKLPKGMTSDMKMNMQITITDK